MRQRVTIFHNNEDAIEPSDIKIQGRSVFGPDILAAREDRFNLGLEELPAEFRDLVQSTHELHIRYSPPFPYHSSLPWSSRLPPGLHVFYTPQEHDKTRITSKLCSLLNAAFAALDCLSVEESFTRLPNDRFSHSTAYQYYQPLQDLSHLVEYVAQHLCSSSDAECKQRVDALRGATSLELSYDSVTHMAKAAVTLPRKAQPISIDAHPKHRLEVGLLTPDQGPQLAAHEIGLTGLLTVVGDGPPSAVLFAAPARHKPTNATFSSSFLQPTGLHPTLQVLVGGSKPPMDDSYCSLHAYLTLPKQVFADKYQFDDGLFLASKNLTALRFISQPVDLEAPDYVMSLWGSTLLLEVRQPKDDKPWTFEVPLHLRYQSPCPGGQRSFVVPYPAVFWACTSEEGAKFSNSPFDRVNLGYDGLFGPQTIFWHLEPVPRSGGNLIMSGVTPVLDLDKSRSVSTVTAVVVISGFAWVLWKILLVYVKTGHGAARSTADIKQKKKN